MTDIEDVNLDNQEDLKAKQREKLQEAEKHKKDAETQDAGAARLEAEAAVQGIHPARKELLTKNAASLRKSAQQHREDSRAAKKEADAVPGQLGKMKSDFDKASAALLGPEFKDFEDNAAQAKKGANLNSAQNFARTLGANEYKKVGGSVLQKIGVDKLVQIGANKKEVIGGTHTQVVGDASNVTWNSTASWKVTGTLFEFVGSAKTAITVATSVTASCAVKVTATTGAYMNLKRAITFDSSAGPVYKRYAPENKLAPTETKKVGKFSALLGSLNEKISSVSQKIGAKTEKIGGWTTDASKWTAKIPTVTMDSAKVKMTGKLSVDGVSLFNKAVKVNGTLWCKKDIKAPNLKAK